MGEVCNTMFGKRGLGVVPNIVLRFGLVAFCLLIGELVPKLACITGYIGSLGVSLIGFLLPALAHIRLLKGRLSVLEWLQDGVLLFAGVAAVTFGILETEC